MRILLPPSPLTSTSSTFPLLYHKNGGSSSSNARSRTSLQRLLLAGLALSLTIYAFSKVNPSSTNLQDVYRQGNQAWRSQLERFAGSHALESTADDEEENALITDKYSIVVSTFNRAEHLHHFLGRVANGALPRLDAVFIAWGLGAVDPPDWLDLNAYNVPVYLERAKVNSLTERFRLPSNMATNAALWIDDDLQIHPDDIEFGFDAYQQFSNATHRITGYSGRQVLLDDIHGMHTYELYQSSYSMVLTNSAFMDRTMLKWFWNMEDERIVKSIEYVDTHMNCEDILMNFVVTDKNGLPPLLVDAFDVQQLKTSGISDQPGHYGERSECMREFIKIWGTTLKTTDIKLVPSTKEIHRKTVKLDPPFNNPYKPWAEGKKFEAPGTSRM